MENDMFLTFDDVMLVPQYSNILSRSEVDISTSIGKEERQIVLKTPVISAPMDTVTELEMATAMSYSGGLGIIHRYMTIDAQADMVRACRNRHGVMKEFNVGAAIGATGDYLERFVELVDAGARLICIDVAHGDHVLVKDALLELSKRHERSRIHIMTGNIAGSEAYRRLSDWGADSIRCSVGAGSVCQTRINTGHGVPNIGMLQRIDAERRAYDGASVILDGGIKTSGDIVKAFAFGADAVMVGGMLSGTQATPGQFRHRTLIGKLLEMAPIERLPYAKELKKIRDRSRFKSFRGMASTESQLAWRGKKPAASEGLATTVAYKGSTYERIEEIVGHIRSGCSYSGVRSLPELYEKSEYVVQTSAGQREAHPHIHQN